MPMPVVRGQRRTTRRDLSQIEAIQALQIIDGTLFRFGMPLALIGCESTVPAWEATTSPPSSEEARCGASPRGPPGIERCDSPSQWPEEKRPIPAALSEVERVALPLRSFLLRSVFV